jgi:OOP family OmpA-OmpF porin
MGARADGTVTRTIVDERDVVRRGWRPVGGWWWAALLLVPLLLGLIGASIVRGGVESDLTARSLAALKTAGLDGAGVSFDGRDARITLPAGMDSAKALAVVGGVDGVRVAQLAAGASGATATPTAAAATPSAAAPSAAVVPFGLTRTAAGIVLTGSVPDEATRAALVASAKAAAPGVTVTDQLTIAAAAPAGGLPSAANLGALVAALPAGSSAAYQNGTLTLTGEVATDAAKATASAAATAAFPTAKIANNLTVSAPAVAAECTGLTAALTDSQKANPLLFATNVTSLTDAQQAQVKALAAKISACLGKSGAPAAVLVTGHADPQGNAAVNERLSAARAESVKAALVAGGVPAATITTSAKGSADSTGDTSTAEGRAANRRVDISVK